MARIAAVAVAALGNNQQGYQGQTDTLSSVSCRTPQRNARCECRKKTALAVVASCSAVSTALLLLLLLLPCPTNRSLSVPCFVFFSLQPANAPAAGGGTGIAVVVSHFLPLSLSLSLSLSLVPLDNNARSFCWGEEKGRHRGSFLLDDSFSCVKCVCCVVLCCVWLRSCCVGCRVSGQTNNHNQND